MPAELAPIVVASTAFASLGLVALSMGLLARRYSRAALGIGLTGLLALTTTSTWIATASPTAPSPPGPDPRIARLRSDLYAARHKRAVALVARNRALRVARQRSVTENPPITAAPNAPATPRIQIVRVPSWKVVQSPARPTTPLSCLTSPGFDPPSEQCELVAGRRGIGHLLRLVIDGRRLAFPARQYSMPELRARLEASARELKRQLDGRPAGQHVRLYLRGYADATTIGDGARPTASRRFEVLSKIRGQDTFADKAVPFAVAGTVENAELPNLRADWVRSVIEPTLGVPIEILDNEPGPGQPRTVDLIVFVES